MSEPKRIWQHCLMVEVIQRLIKYVNICIIFLLQKDSANIIYRNLRVEILTTLTNSLSMQFSLPRCNAAISAHLLDEVILNETDN